MLLILTARFMAAALRGSNVELCGACPSPECLVLAISPPEQVLLAGAQSSSEGRFVGFSFAHGVYGLTSLHLIQGLALLKSLRCELVLI